MIPSIAEMPNSATKPIAADTLNGVPVRNSAKDAADQRHRHHARRQQRVGQRAEIDEQQHADQRQAQRHDNRQALDRVLQFAELADPFEAVAGRQPHLLARSCCCASCTAPPRSRPRTLNLIGM